MGANTFLPLLLTDAGVFELRDPPVPRTDLPTGIWRILVDEQGAVLSIGDASFVWDPASGALQPTDHEATHARLEAEHDKLNPARITRGINRIQQQLIELAKNRTLGTRPAA